MITGHGGSRNAGYSPLLNRLLGFCAELDAASLGEGRYDFFPGEDIPVLINERITQPVSQRPAEVHRRYAELHYILSGGECIGYYPDTGRYQISQDLLKEKDTLYYRDAPEAPEILLSLGPGDYAVFFPEDVHRPFCVLPRSEPDAVKKIVIKFPCAFRCTTNHESCGAHGDL